MAPALTGHTPPPISPFLLRFFRRVVRRYFRRHFRAVELQGADGVRGLRGPMIIFGNHSSWWDPMMLVLLGEQLLPGHRHYAPMDEHALAMYPILRKLGIFPVEMATSRGAVRFLRTAEAILREGGVLWLTPQGRFADVREWPLRFKPGLAALAQRLPEVPLVPLALEYTFWDERLPEALVRFGHPMHLTSDLTVAEATSTLEEVLAATMRELQTAAVARDPSAFIPLLSGARGTGGAYGVIRRLGALLRGRRPVLDHTLRPADEAPGDNL